MKLPPTVTNKQIIDVMMSRLGARTAPKLRSTIPFEINAYVDTKELQATLPWFLVKPGELAFVTGAVSAALPLDFLREVEDDQPMVYVEGAMTQVLKKTTFERLNFDGDGPPDHYAILGEEFFIAPRADSDLTVRFRYMAETGEFVDDEQVVSNPWIVYAQDLITFGTLQVIANFHIQDPDMANRFAGVEQRAADSLWRANEARQHTNADYKIED